MSNINQSDSPLSISLYVNTGQLLIVAHSDILSRCVGLDATWQSVSYDAFYYFASAQITISISASKLCGDHILWATRPKFYEFGCYQSCILLSPIGRVFVYETKPEIMLW